MTKHDMHQAEIERAKHDATEAIKKANIAQEAFEQAEKTADPQKMATVRAQAEQIELTAEKAQTYLKAEASRQDEQQVQQLEEHLAEAHQDVQHL
ncbi:hypothetical protein [Paenibacillus sp. MBLB4367]|uniref:hypothetical protein n=1 Tax=Paenibacillus sp. MBLB4367 TaxID=3384767 RepID=UPI003907EC55